MGALFTPIMEIVADQFYTNFGLLLIVGIFVFLDTVMGVSVAFFKKEATSKEFFYKFYAKFIAYSVLIIICFSVFILTQTTKIYNLDLEAAEMIITYPLTVVIVREFWSIFEGINILQPGLLTNIKLIFTKILKK